MQASARLIGRAQRPIHLTDLIFEIGRSLPDQEAPSHYRTLLGLVRLHGTPIGWIAQRLVSARCDGRALTAAILARHESTILRHLLVDALASGCFTGRPRDLVEAAHLPPGEPGGSITVAVCTRDRPVELAGCLASLARLHHPATAVLVVDNAPADSRTEQLVRADHPDVRYVRESRPGLSWARNRAIAECQTEILAFVDDDGRVDAGWTRAIADLMTACPDAMAVTGLVVPHELVTDAQIAFEQHGGFGRGFRRRWIRREHGRSAARGLANTGTFGTGTNVAFRRAVFDAIGTFDPRLGAGTTIGGGEDLDMFFRVLQAGHTLVYEPAALVRHRHRSDVDAVRDQIRSWGSGMQAHLLRNSDAFPDERGGLMRLRTKLLLLYYPRRILGSLLSQRLRVSLSAAELRGALSARGLYQRASGDADPAFAAAASAIGATPNRRTPPAPRLAIRELTLEIAEPMPAVVLEAHDADRIRLDVRLHGRRIGKVDIVSGGHPLRRAEAADAIAANLLERLVDAPACASVLRGAFRFSG
jgi:GT2 family glycosyltransferase